MMATVTLFGKRVEVERWWREWVAYLANAEKRTVDEAYARLNAGIITREDSAVFSDFWRRLYA